MKKLMKMYEDIQALIENGQFPAAIEAMNALLLEHVNFSQGYHDLGSLYLNAGNKEKAETNYQKAVDLEPENNSFLKGIGDFYYVEMQDYDKGLEFYRKIIANGVNDAEVYFIAGNLSLVARKFDDAINFYEKVLDIEPRHAEAFEYLEKVKTHLISQDADQNEDSVAALYKRATDMGAEGKDELAVSILEKVIKVDPKHAMAHNDLGVYHFQLGNEERSLEHYRIATRIDPFNAIFQKNLADFLCFVKGNIAEALTIYSQLLKEDPQDVEVLMAVGHVNRAIGRVADSEMYYERVLDIEPWNFDAGEMLDGLKISSESKAAIN